MLYIVLYYFIPKKTPKNECLKVKYGKTDLKMNFTVPSNRFETLIAVLVLFKSRKMQEMHNQKSFFIETTHEIIALSYDGI